MATSSPPGGSLVNTEPIPYAPPVLPPPLYEIDPTLHCRLLRYINCAVGLAPADRLVLGGVFQHLPVLDTHATTELLNRVQLLDATNLKLLANLFTAGLLDARSWGGSRTASTRSRTGTPADSAPSNVLTTSAEYNELFCHLSITSPFPPPQSPTERQSTASHRVKRSAKLSGLCLERQHDECPLTAEADIALETAHLVPFSIAAPRRADTAFWLMLAICLGPVLRDHLHSIIHGHKACTTVNGLAMQSVLHKYFDRGAMALEPDLLHTSTSFDSTTTTSFDVMFRWRDLIQGLRLRVTMLPLDPAEQITTAQNGSWAHVTLPGERRIEDGHKFRLCTDDPKRLPLPHPFLLSLHARLWSMIQSAGLAETVDRKRKRLDKACEPPDDDDDDDDSEDDSRDGARKRVNRMKRRLAKQISISGKKNDNGKDQGVRPAGSTSTTQTRDAARDPLCPTSVEKQVPQMMFLEREYLAFRLGNPDLPIDSDFSDTDADTDTDSICSSYAEYASDSEEESTFGDLVSTENTDSGCEEASANQPHQHVLQPSKQFLEREWENFIGRGQRKSVLSGPRNDA